MRLRGAGFGGEDFLGGEGLAFPDHEAVAGLLDQAGHERGGQRGVEREERAFQGEGRAGRARQRLGGGRDRDDGAAGPRARVLKHGRERGRAAERRRQP